MDLDLVDFIFNGIITVILLVIAIEEIISAKRRRRFENEQMALDLLAAVNTEEIIRLLHQESSSDSGQEFLKTQYELALSRQESLSREIPLNDDTSKNITDALQRLSAAIEDPSPELIKRQQKANETSGLSVKVNTDRYAWNGELALGVLALASAVVGFVVTAA